MEPAERVGARTALKESRTDEHVRSWPLLLLSVGSSAILVYTMPSWGPLLVRALGWRILTLVAQVHATSLAAIHDFT